MFLGHLWSAEGIEVDSEKIKAIQDWPTPTSVTDILQFMGSQCCTLCSAVPDRQGGERHSALRTLPDPTSLSGLSPVPTPALPISAPVPPSPQATPHLGFTSNSPKHTPTSESP